MESARLQATAIPNHICCYYASHENLAPAPYWQDALLKRITYNTPYTVATYRDGAKLSGDAAPNVILDHYGSDTFDLYFRPTPTANPQDKAKFLKEMYTILAPHLKKFDIDIDNPQYHLNNQQRRDAQLSEIDPLIARFREQHSLFLL